MEELTGGDPEIHKGLNSMYEDQAYWPDEQQAFRVSSEIQDFIIKLYLQYRDSDV